MKRFYLDTNATYGVDSEHMKALLSMGEALCCLNPNSIHQESQKYRVHIDKVRSDFCSIFSLNESTHQVIFNSGATEGNNTLLSSVFDNAIIQHAGSPNIVTTSIEHSSVSKTLDEYVERSDTKVVLRKVTPSGGNSFIDDVISQIDEETVLLSVMWANNESGEIFPIEDLFTLVREQYPKVLLHTDAVQILGKTSVNLSSFPFDFLTASAHKFGALSGIGMLVKNRECDFTPLLHGAAQEERARAGTQNTLGILSLGLALEAIPAHIKSFQSDIQQVRDSFEETLLRDIPDIQIIAKEKQRLPNTSFVHFPNLRADDLLVALDLEGIACSAGSACSSGKQLGSLVALGMGYAEEVARSVIRFSFRADFSDEDLMELTRRITKCVKLAYTHSIPNKDVSIKEHSPKNILLEEASS